MDKIYLKDLEPTSVPESQIHHHNDQESQNQPTNNLTPKSDGNPIDRNFQFYWVDTENRTTFCSFIGNFNLNLNYPI